MPNYYYKGRTSRGDSIEGVVEANSPDAVATQLINSGITPVDITEKAETQDVFKSANRFFEPKPDLTDLILFSRQMYSLTKAGVPIIRAIRGLADSTQNSMMAVALDNIADNLESGRELATAFGQHSKIFTPIYISMVRVGENSGRLDEAFIQIAHYLELEKDTRERIKQALRYPTIVLGAIVIAIAIINRYVIPAFAKVFAGFNAELPWATKVLIATSDFTVAYWYYILFFASASIAGFLYYIKTENGRYKWDKNKLRLPIVGGIIHRALLARFARSFSMATRSGVPLIQALTVVAKAIGNEFVGDRILSIRNGIERGDTLTRTVAATNLFTPLVIQMIAVGEETGQVDDMLDEVADYYEREVDYDLKNLSSAIEPILIIAIGAMVFILALGVFLPMWDLAAAARGGR